MEGSPLNIGKVMIGEASECWEWDGAHTSSGYGHGKHYGRATGAHRVVYELCVGPIPDGLDLDHLCRNRGCCNPAHLEPVTRRENAMRGDTIPARHAARTTCSGCGNPYDLFQQGRRRCSACRKAGRRRRYAERRAA